MSQFTCLPLMVILLVIAPLGAPAQHKLDPLRLLSFRLESSRVTPASVRVPKGRYIVRVQSGVTGGEVGFDLIRGSVATDKVASRTISAGRSRAQAFLELTPGKYELRIAGKVAMAANIEVQP